MSLYQQLYFNNVSYNSERSEQFLEYFALHFMHGKIVKYAEKKLFSKMMVIKLVILDKLFSTIGECS